MGNAGHRAAPAGAWAYLADRPSLAAPLAIGIGLAVRVPLAFNPGYVGDIEQWQRMTREILLRGLPHVYRLVLQEPAIGVYPPLYHYALGAVGWVYRTFFLPEFALETQRLTTLIKLTPIVGDCLIALVAYGFVRRLYAPAGRGARSAALISLLAVLLNPAIIFNSAYWGMFGDSLYTLWVVVALASAACDRVALAWVAITAAVLTKPQAAPFVPLIVWVTLVRPLWDGERRGRWKGMLWRWARAALAGLLTLGLVLLPFIIAGTVHQIVQALANTVGLMPVLSANAHNIWWLFTFGNGWASDAEPLLTLPVVGTLTARTVGLLAFGLAYLLALIRLGWRKPERASPESAWSLWTTAAYVTFAFTMLATEMHENYTYPALALLSAALPSSHRVRVFAVLLTVTALTTMVLHDPVIRPLLEGPLTVMVKRMEVGNSAFNFGLFLVWSGLLVGYRDVAGALRLGQPGGRAPLPAGG